MIVFLLQRDADGYTFYEVETQNLPAQFEFVYTLNNEPQEIVTISIDSNCECFLCGSTVHPSCVLSLSSHFPPPPSLSPPSLSTNTQIVLAAVITCIHKMLQWMVAQLI